MVALENLLLVQTEVSSKKNAQIEHEWLEKIKKLSTSYSMLSLTYSLLGSFCKQRSYN